MRHRFSVNVIITSLLLQIASSVVVRNVTDDSNYKQTNKSLGVFANSNDNNLTRQSNKTFLQTTNDTQQSKENNLTIPNENSTKQFEKNFTIPLPKNDNTEVNNKSLITNKTTNVGNFTSQLTNNDTSLNNYTVKHWTETSNYYSTENSLNDNDALFLRSIAYAYKVPENKSTLNSNRTNTNHTTYVKPFDNNNQSRTAVQQNNPTIDNNLDHIGVAVNYTKHNNVHFYQSKETNDERSMFMVDPENKRSKTFHIKINQNKDSELKNNNIINHAEQISETNTKKLYVPKSEKLSLYTNQLKRLSIPKQSAAANKLKNIQGRVRQIKDRIEKNRRYNSYIGKLLHQKESEIVEMKPIRESNFRTRFYRKNRQKIHPNQRENVKVTSIAIPIDEIAMKRNSVRANRIYSVEDQPIRQQIDKKNVLIQQAANELKSVLNKKTLSSRTKSKLLTQIFDDKGDNEKAKVATEIFREALEPSHPTHGQVGDLGAEMIKVSLLARKKSHRAHRQNKNLYKKKKQSFPERLKGNLRQNKLDLSEYIPEMEESVTGDRKSKLKINASNFGWDVPPKPAKKKTVNKKMLKENMEENSSKRLQEIRKSLRNMPKNHSSLYMLLKKSARKINMKGRSAKLLSVKDLGNMTKFKGNQSLKFPQSRKDLVIELDDDGMSGGKDLREMDPIMSLIRKFAKTDQDDDIAIIDERDLDVGNTNDIDDGYLSSNRRRIGENLFMESFSDNDQNLTPESEEPVEETGSQRSYLPPEESFIDDNYEAKLESYFPLASLEDSYFQPPAVYDQVQDDAALLSTQKGLAKSAETDPEIMMELEKRRRESIPDT